MSTYMVIDAATAEIIRENITSEDLQRADKLLQASQLQANRLDYEQRYGKTKRAPYSPPRTPRGKKQQQTVGQACDSLAWYMVGGFRDLYTLLRFR